MKAMGMTSSLGVLRPGDAHERRAPAVAGVHAESQHRCPKVKAVSLDMCSYYHAICASVCLPYSVLDMFTRLLCFLPPFRPSGSALPVLFPALSLSQASEGRSVAAS